MESLTEREVRSWIPERRAEQSKKDFGRLLIVAGSTGMAGAAVLCGKAALRSGVGLATFYVPGDLFPILQTALYEATCLERYEGRKERAAHLAACTAVAAGPGLGRREEDLILLMDVLAAGKPAVLDADALNDIVRFDLHDAVRDAQGSVVLTPHEGEAARLLGTTSIENRETAVRTLADRYQATVILKGHHSLVASPDGVVTVNPTGCPGMAKGGSGDVLTGMIGAFLAKGMPAGKAALAGAYLHGMAGELCQKALGEESILARDLIDAIPRAFKSL